MEPLFSIGEMAKKSQLSIQRLRYYDKIGLLVPAFTDPTSGYRYYKTAQEEQLNLIQALQYMGFSLQELKQYLDKNTMESLPDLLIKYQQKLKDEEARIARKKWLIDRYQGLLKRETDSTKLLTVSLTFAYRATSNTRSCGYFKRPRFPSRSSENREPPWSFEKLSAVSWLLCVRRADLSFH